MHRILWQQFTVNKFIYTHSHLYGFRCGVPGMLNSNTDASTISARHPPSSLNPSPFTTVCSCSSTLQQNSLQYDSQARCVGRYLKTYQRNTLRRFLCVVSSFWKHLDLIPFGLDFREVSLKFPFHPFHILASVFAVYLGKQKKNNPFHTAIKRNSCGTLVNCF